MKRINSVADERPSSCRPEMSRPKSKRAVKAALVSALLLGAAGLATTDSRGEGGRSLTPEQASAKAAFDEGIADDVKAMKESCGTDFSVTTDFENYDRATYTNGGGKGGGGKGGGDTGGGAKKKGGDTPEEWKRDQQSASGPLRTHLNTCGYAIQRLAKLCPKKRSPSATPHLPSVRGIACLFGGLQAGQEGDRSNDKVQRNMSFSNGVLTFHIAPHGTPNVDENVFHALIPLTERIDRTNGTPCAQARDCRSGACSKGVCAACGPQAACSGINDTCGTNGVCFHTLTPEEAAQEKAAQDEHQARVSEKDSKSGGASKAQAKKALGQKCQSNSECESKICGTISSGSLHKCTDKR